MCCYLFFERFSITTKIDIPFKAIFHEIFDILCNKILSFQNLMSNPRDELWLYDGGIRLSLGGGARNFPTGLTFPTRGLKYGFQGTINNKILRKNHF